MRTFAALQAGLLAGLVLFSGCGASAPRDPAAPMMAPTLTIEQFLRAANQNDLDTMAGLFGTTQGAVSKLWPRSEIDQRMFLLASVLRHSDYSIGQEQVVPGRRDEAIRYPVRMVVGGDEVSVPFTLVRSPAAAHWLIENIDVEAITRRTGRR